jgi:hypothetical protein
LEVLLFPHADSMSAPVASTPRATPNWLDLKWVPLIGRASGWFDYATWPENDHHFVPTYGSVAPLGQRSEDSKLTNRLAKPNVASAFRSRLWTL